MRFFSLVLAVTLLCSVSFGQQATAQTTPKAPAASIPADAGPATQKFHKLSNQAKEYYQKFIDFDKEYPTATPARQKEIQAEVQKMAETIQTFKAPLLAAAKAAFKEAPNKDDSVKAFLLNNIVMMVNYDDYENALKECDELIRLGLLDQPIFEIAAFSAYNSNNFAYAESAIANAKKVATKALDTAKQQGKTQAQINKEGIGQVHPGLAELEKNLPFYKAAWAKEKALRQASAQAKDCPTVKLQTTAGDITIELFAKEAPNTVANFIELVNKGFYNGLTFHRVMQGFMAQGGDPKGNGTGGPGYFIPCEVDNPNARIHFRGSLSMAHAGKDTGGSQFFITFVPTKWLDGKHTVFGRVTGGIDTLAKIQRDPDPKTPGFEPTKIIKAEVTYMPPQLTLPPVKKLPDNR